MYTTPAIEPGDQWELGPPAATLHQDTIPLPLALSHIFTGTDPHVLLDTPKGEQAITYDADRNALHGRALRHLARQPGILRLECSAADPLTLTYRSPTDQNVTVRHTPDFFVLRTDGIVWEEWKQAEAMRRVPPGSRCACSPGSGKQPGRDINADKQLIHQHRDTWSRHTIPFRLHAAHGWWERIFHTRSVPPGECQSHHHPGTDACIIRGEAHRIWQSRRPLAGGIFRWSD